MASDFKSSRGTNAVFGNEHAGFLVVLGQGIAALEGSYRGFGGEP